MRMNKFFPIFIFAIIAFVFNSQNVYSEPANDSITILFTHDLHDHYYPFPLDKDGESVTVGGYARLATAIENEREVDPNLVLVDAGDFSMGTLFQTIFATDAPGIRLMGEMGYDAITFGNHEFDFRSEGLANSLRVAQDSGDPLPEIVSTNIAMPTDDDGEIPEAATNLKKAMDEYNVKDYAVIERDEIKIGVIGLLGEDADSNAPMSGMLFDDIVESAKKTVKLLQDEEKVDLIIAISHSGTSTDKAKSEDEILADKVPEIDVIVSGHSHTVLQEPIIINETVIGSTGEYGENLGSIKLSKDNDRNWQLDSYQLIPITDDLKPNANIADKIEQFKNIVQESYLDPFEMEFDEVLATTPFNFTPSAQMSGNHAEDALANLIGDAFIHAIKEEEGENYEPIAASILPVGTIRGSFVKGDITVSDVFNVSSLGIGPDEVSGYPLVEVYLTGKELKTVAEVDASVSPLMPAAQLYISGLSYTFNPKRLIFNKVTDVHLQDQDGSTSEIDNKKLYRVIAGLYSGQMLPVVSEKSFGLLSVVPKTKTGEPIENYEDEILYRTDGSNQEIKEWAAIAEYLKTFEVKNGTPEIPEYYNQTHGRKIVESNGNIFAILKSPNKITFAIYGIALLIITVVVFSIRFVVKKRRAKRNFF